MSKLIKPVFNDVIELINDIEKKKKKYKSKPRQYPSKELQEIKPKPPKRTVEVVAPAPILRYVPELPETVVVKKPRIKFVAEPTRTSLGFSSVEPVRKSITVGSRERTRRRRRTKVEMAQAKELEKQLKEQFPDISKTELKKKVKESPVKTEEFYPPPATPTRGRSFAEYRSSSSSDSSPSPSRGRYTTMVAEDVEPIPIPVPSPVKRGPGRPKKVVAEENVGSGKLKRGRKINPNSKRQQNLRKNLDKVD